MQVINSGPAFSGPNRSFDFTLLFEDSILVIAPSALLLTAANVHWFALHGNQSEFDLTTASYLKRYTQLGTSITYDGNMNTYEPRLIKSPGLCICIRSPPIGSHAHMGYWPFLRV